MTFSDAAANTIEHIGLCRKKRLAAELSCIGISCRLPREVTEELGDFISELVLPLSLLCECGCRRDEINARLQWNEREEIAVLTVGGECVTPDVREELLLHFGITADRHEITVETEILDTGEVAVRFSGNRGERSLLGIKVEPELAYDQ